MASSRDVPALNTVIARAVAAERIRAGLTQAELGESLRWSRQTVTAIEAGVRPVQIAELPRLCEALGVTLDQLLRDATGADRRRLGFL